MAWRTLYSQKWRKRRCRTFDWKSSQVRPKSAFMHFPVALAVYLLSLTDRTTRHATVLRHQICRSNFVGVLLKATTQKAEMPVMLCPMISV